jgi:hypothetical protein
MMVTIGPDDGTAYHHEARAASPDVTAGNKAPLVGEVRPTRDAGDGINPGTAGDITVTP